MHRIFALLLLSGFFTSQGQELHTTFYDSMWRLTIKEFACFYRVGELDQKNLKYNGEVRDYYRDGQLQMKGSVTNSMKRDTFFFYYPNGNLKMKGRYRENKRFGVWYTYHENGKIKEKLAFNDEFICPFEAWDENGHPAIKRGTGPWKTSYHNEMMSLIEVEGYYADTLRHGTWTYYERSLLPSLKSDKKLILVEKYDKGIYVAGEYHWPQGRTEKMSGPLLKILPEERKFRAWDEWAYSRYAHREYYPFLKFLPKLDSSVFPVSRLARFSAGKESLTAVFQNAADNNRKLEGITLPIHCSFHIRVDSKGKLAILQDANQHLLDEPAERAFYTTMLKTLKSLPAWEPAHRKGTPVVNDFFFGITLEKKKVSIQLLSSHELLSSYPAN